MTLPPLKITSIVVKKIQYTSIVLIFPQQANKSPISIVFVFVIEFDPDPVQEKWTQKFTVRYTFLGDYQ